NFIRNFLHNLSEIVINNDFVVNCFKTIYSKYQAVLLKCMQNLSFIYNFLHQLYAFYTNR
ncbi:hypothetical protein DD594_27455, partial [Enterobacter cloacae complex sp. 4DZ1-17B1]